MDQSRGYLYVATGEKFIEEATRSAKSLRRVSDDVSIAIAADSSVDNEVFDEKITIKDPAYGFADKINNLDRSPFDRTIFLDSDTNIFHDISNLFDLLEHFDIAAVPNNDHTSRETFDLESVPDCFPEYNTGVLVYRTEVMSNFAPKWNSFYEKDHPHDQPSFREALFKSDLRLSPLTPEYNFMFRYPQHIIGKVKVSHGRLGDVPYFSPIRKDETDIIKSVNKSSKSRIYLPHPLFGPVVKTHMDPSFHFRRSVTNRGILGTASEVLSRIKQRLARK